MSLGFIIFSRLDSKRLPRKALLELNGKTLLERVIDRCKNAELNIPIIIATSDRFVDDEIINFCKYKKLPFFRGPLDNVALRAIDCCKEFNLDGFIRICGDRLFMPYEFVQIAYDIFKLNDVDLVSNSVNTKTYPKGCTIEIVSSNALEKAYKQGLNLYEKEHLTSFFYSNQEKFCIKSIPDYVDDEHAHNLSLDTIKHFEKFEDIIKKFKGNIEKLSLEEILKLSKNWDMEALNEKR